MAVATGIGCNVEDASGTAVGVGAGVGVGVSEGDGLGVVMVAVTSGKVLAGVLGLGTALVVDPPPTPLRASGAPDEGELRTACTSPNAASGAGTE